MMFKLPPMISLRSLACIACLTLTSFAFLQTKKVQNRKEPITEKSAPVTLRHTGRERVSAEHEILSLSLEDVRNRLPDKLKPLHDGSIESEPLKLLFRRMGMLAGEDALDEIFTKYGRKSSTVMPSALGGWIGSGDENALHAFEKLFTKKKNPSFPGFSMQWKGTFLLSGYG